MTRRAVLIDDSPSLLKQLAAYLEGSLGIQVAANGKDGQEAVELYRRHRPDLITMDLTMPRKDGLVALREILAEFPDARVMIISALRGREVTKCLKAGARAYVEKPLRLKDEEFRRDFQASLDEALGP